MGSTTRFLVTGAAGFVGARLCRSLADRGADVHAVVAPSSNPWRLDGERRVVRHAVDLRDAAGVQRVVLDARPAVVYSLASHGAYPHQTDATRILESNVLGLTNLLQACEAIDYRLLVHTGSSSEYGRKRSPMRESDELVPESVYGVSKAAQSLLCRQWSVQRRRPVVVFRLFSVYGPLEEATRLIPKLMCAALDDTPIRMASPGTSRDFIHVDDVVDVLSRVEELGRLGGSILNLGTGTQTALAGVVATLESIISKPLQAEWNTMASRSWDTETWVADTTELRQALPDVSMRSLRDGLKETLDWFREHRRDYRHEAQGAS